MMTLDRRRAVRGMMALTGASLVRAPRAATVLDDVIGRHVAARGGAAALDRVTQCRIKLDITERGQTIQGNYAADIAGLVRIDIRVEGKLVYREGVDRKGVWLWPDGEAQPKDSTATGAANALLHGIEGNLVGLHRYASRGNRLSLMPEELIDGVRYQVVEVKYKTGHVSYLYIDPVTSMIARKRDERAYHPDVDQTKARVESRYLDFKTVDGIVSSDRNEDFDLRTGKLLSVNQVTAREWNPGIAAEVFERTYAP